MIKTKSIYGRSEDSDGKRILVSRNWPRGIPRKRLNIVEWARKVAPSKNLLQGWKQNEINWEEYCRRYMDEMSSQNEKITELASMAGSGTITLVCFEPEHNPHCHRHMLKRLIEKVIEK